MNHIEKLQLSILKQASSRGRQVTKLIERARASNSPKALEFNQGLQDLIDFRDLSPEELAEALARSKTKGYEPPSFWETLLNPNAKVDLDRNAEINIRSKVADLVKNFWTAPSQTNLAHVGTPNVWRLGDKNL